VTKERGKKREKGKREYSKIYHRERCEEVRHMGERERGRFGRCIRWDRGSEERG
jgi:hypothetical protein